MEYTVLGNTGIKVSRLCYGSLTISPIQKNLSVEEGAGLLKFAVNQGVNFVDTGDGYQTNSYINSLLKEYPDTVVCSKSFPGYGYEGTIKKTYSELEELGIKQVQLFFLHAVWDRKRWLKCKEGDYQALKDLNIIWRLSHD